MSDQHVQSWDEAQAILDNDPWAKTGRAGFLLHQLYTTAMPGETVSPDKEKQRASPRLAWIAVG